MSSPKATPPPVVEAEVKRCYSSWGTTYYREYYGENAPYPPVHLDLVRRIVDRLDCRRLLDAGCGPASMLRHLAAPGRSLHGFDLTPEMVAEARRVMEELGTPAAHVWEGSVLRLADFIPPGESRADFDCTVCCGVLPHIPESSDTECIANIRESLRPGGHAIVEARNELFSLFTLNRYSHQLFMERLVPVAALRAAAASERAGLDQALGQIEGLFRTDLPPVRKGKEAEPGYDEVLSRVHNPLVLRDQFLQNGFDQARLAFYHFHCLPPMVQHLAPDVYRHISLQMEENPDDWRGLFMASAFFVVARRS
jgi:2-polyprenyl-3-methyl-5-hydroxy-6-metoxy-1,4-benzoquinol methylase